MQSRTEFDDVAQTRNDNLNGMEISSPFLLSGPNTMALRTLALAYLQHLTRCANPNRASLREVNDFIWLVLADGHERTNGIAVVVQMVPGRWPAGKQQ